MIAEKITQTAHDYIGQREKPRNSGFINEDFQKKMEEVGWDNGEAWCASFAKLVFLEAYKDNPERIAEIEKLFSKNRD